MSASDACDAHISAQIVERWLVVFQRTGLGVGWEGWRSASPRDLGCRHAILVPMSPVPSRCTLLLSGDESTREYTEV